ncbi:hypothetical protein ENUP19_0213G0009 [Entamoeba nuttalli]|uniref:Helicase domain containing protein n=2 Tax=Entamoeba nuttalli TaxID=412467 RepID=K2H505_ENTNP|nr:helicase domain containing protein [Entamoeba nuttalli P19]EKE41477.1 helicase domain containing protein [Entamoeba nuttalli P19]|eukprot:XP_008856191.1 helicase domain containing protein [Entamoeba nuttalli P19]
MKRTYEEDDIIDEEEQRNEQIIVPEETDRFKDIDEEEIKKEVKEEDVQYVEHLEKEEEWTDDAIEGIYKQRLEKMGFSVKQTKDSVAPLGEKKTFKSGLVMRNELYQSLFEHQRIGVKWMYELFKQHAGGIIGDEMGLGKTLMVLAFLEGLQCTFFNKEKTETLTCGNSLVVAPLTLIPHWVSEAHRFVPSLRVIILHNDLSSTNKDNINLLNTTHNSLYLTTYEFIRTHKDILSEYLWFCIVLDEGHKIKNPNAEISKAVKMLEAHQRLLLSGSPIQNNLSELWSLFDFVYPGKLGTLPLFQQQFIKPIRYGSYTSASYFQFMAALKCAKGLRDMIAPFFLRRIKKEVLPSLPTRQEKFVYCPLTPKQRSMYLEYVNSSSIAKVIDGDMDMLAAIDTLRKICNHPHLINKTEDLTPETIYKESSKLKYVCDLLKQFKKEGHKALIFCQTRQMLNIIEQMMLNENFKYLRMDGLVSSNKRPEYISQFNNDPTVLVFILTTRVGGLGINLTGADRVIMYDPDWNPTVDSQAKERTLRIGQDRDVIIYRLICSGTIEEHIYQKQMAKEILSDKILCNEEEKTRKQFKKQFIREFFQLIDEKQKEVYEIEGEKEEKEEVTTNDKKSTESDLMNNIYNKNENGINQIIEEKSKGLTDIEKRLTDEETQKIAERAIHQLKMEKKREMMTEKKSGDINKSNLEKKSIAERLADFIESKNGKGVSTNEVIDKFADDVKGNNECRIFKEILKKMCKFNPKLRMWIPR